MRTIQQDRGSIKLELSGYECHIIRTALARAAMLPRHEGDDDFPRRFGWPYSGEFPARRELRGIRERLPEWHEDNCEHTRDFTRRELIIVLRSLSELADGILIPEWEFPILTGAERQDVRDLLHAVHRVLVGRKE